MNGVNPLELEVLSGPLDGEILKITEPTEWSQSGRGPLTFPWDRKLGTPQAVLVPREGGWSLEPSDTPVPISLVTRDQKLTGPILLVEGDVLRAGTSWLLVLSC